MATQARGVNGRKGALILSANGGSVQCHPVSGESNEMFSDFRMQVAAAPQIAPVFEVGKGNVNLDGPDADEDVGLEQLTGKLIDGYKFRTSSLRT